MNVSTVYIRIQRTSKAWKHLVSVNKYSCPDAVLTFTVGANSGTFDPVQAGVGTHVLTYTYGTGTCEKTDTRIFVVGALPSINIGPDQTLCIDAPAITLSGYSPQGGIWSGVGITDSAIGVFDAQTAGIGTHILTYTFANTITGCENSAQRAITVAPLPVVDAGDTLLICDNPNDYTLMHHSEQYIVRI